MILEQIVFETHEFWLFIGAQAIVITIATIGFSMRTSNKIERIDANAKSNQHRLDRLEGTVKEMDDNIENIEKEFNQKFTEYKDFVRDKIDELSKEIQGKMESNNISTHKKLNKIINELIRIDPKFDINGKD